MELPPNPLPDLPDPDGLAGPGGDPGALRGDPMLDALERSIAEPPGPANMSMQLSDLLQMDPLGKQLEAVERSVEWGASWPDGGPPTSASATARPPGPLPADAANEIPGPASPPSPQLAPGTPGPPWGDSLDRRRPELGPDPNREHYYHPRASSGSHASAGGGSSTLSVCPDRNELIYRPDDCQDCPRYRHWPDGTDEEPRECWFDWELRQRLSDRVEDDGDRSDRDL